ncbi:MAG: GxxExxY protein [Spirochaetes bacterium]|nr:GxxExxY protein [Spirochaetota bacterium]
MNENELAEIIIGAAIEVHSILGPGLLESAYEKALIFELNAGGLLIESQKIIPIQYKELLINEGFRSDIIVNDIIILELKSVKAIESVHCKQLLMYLKLTNKKLGLLINFNEVLLKNGIKRIINGSI